MLEREAGAVMHLCGFVPLLSPAFCLCRVAALIVDGVDYQLQVYSPRR